MREELTIHERLLKIAEHRFQRRMQAQHAALLVEQEKSADARRCEERGLATLSQRAVTQRAMLREPTGRALHELRLVKLRSALGVAVKAKLEAVNALTQAQADLLRAQTVTHSALKRVKKLEKLNELQKKAIFEE